ncbi:EAL domain-containing protein [Sedimenticola selenatireducens]|uniref:bifunctional diguanylate cyclase/phosphodiesterase n=1 Tax=Sedimenticola selenatireducens TaxID=191960 RepID=UPI002AABD862|nr:EAL domain-containing protein [Sedimenticola selenatireducens]
MKLRAKILILIFPLVVIPLLMLGWAAYVQLSSTTIQRSLGQMEVLIDQVETNVDSHLRTARANIDLFSRSPLLEKYITTEDEAERLTLMQSSVLRLLSSYQQTYPEYYEIRILLPDGYEDTRSVLGDIPNTTEEESESGYFYEIQRSETAILTKLINNPDNQEIALLISKPLMFMNRSLDPVATPLSLRGYLVITATLDFLEQQIATVQIGEHGYLLVTDRNGKVLFHPNAAWIGRNLATTQFDHMQQLTELKSPSLVHLDDNDVYAHGRQLHSNLYLFAILPEDELLASSRRLGRIVAIIVLGATLLTLLLIYTALNSLVLKPILKLGAAADEMGQGNLLTQVTVESHDEIGTLAKSMQIMGQNLQNSQEQTQYLAYHDTLTGLPNRLMFNEMHQLVLAEAKRHRYRSALMYIDLDDFKRVNDTLGHQAGDELLREISRRLITVLRREDCLALVRPEPTDMVARLGGDEFTILLTKVAQSHEPATVATRLLKALTDPITLGSHEVKIGSSIGITLYPDDGTDTQTLHKNADIAMYHAKREGKNNYQFYSATMNKLSMERMALETKLRHALERDELSLHYQPQVDLVSGEVVGLEALLRWEDPEQGLIPPTTFIPIAEECRLIVPIGEWVLRNACRQNYVWQQAGLKPVTVSVNVSGVQFRHQNLQALVADSLRDSGLAPHYLELELTETSLLEAHEQAGETLTELKELGIGIALDDFGTGYSSLSHLKRLPIDHLKIDRSFVCDVHTNPDDAAIVAAIIAMTRNLGLRVTAEGVEHKLQLNFLRERNCDAIQGFLFSKPLPASGVETVLRNGLQLSEEYLPLPPVSASEAETI